MRAKGAQFTCFTSTTVQILTNLYAIYRVLVGVAGGRGHVRVVKDCTQVLSLLALLVRRYSVYLLY